MASPAVLEEIGFSTSTTAGCKALPDFNTHLTTFRTKLREDVVPLSTVSKQQVITVTDVEESELGDEDEKDHAESFGSYMTLAERERFDEITDQSDGEAAGVRSEIARDLVRRIDELITLIGKIPFATTVHLLKRDLSHAHDALQKYRSESNFLSLVTLLEAALAQLKWKQYTQQHLDAFRKLLDIGYRKPRIVFDDYEQARALLTNSHVDTAPRIDFGSLNMEDLTDDEEG